MQHEIGAEGVVADTGAVRISPRGHAAESNSELEALQQTVRALERKLQGHEQRRRVMDRRMLDLRVLMRTAHGFSRMRDHHQVLQNLLKISIKRTSCGFGLGLLWDAERACFKRLCLHGEPLSRHLEFTLRPQGAFWDLVSQGDAFLWRDILDEEGELALPESMRKLGGEIWIPLTLEEEVLGLVVLGQHPQGRPLGPQEVDFLTFLAQQASQAIHMALLHTQHSRQCDEIARSMQNLKMLYQINDAINTTQDIEALLGVILAQALEALSAMRGSVLLWDESQELLSVRVTRGFTHDGLLLEDREGLCCRTFTRGEGIAGRVFDGGQAEVIHQITREPGFVGQLLGVQSMICAPLRVEGETLGVLCLVKGEGELGFADSDLHLVGALANQAAMALYKTRLHELATRDGLTRMLTRRFFMRRLQDELKRAQRFDRPVSLVLIDVDRFKQINDTRGHLVGDAVLQAISSLLRANIRDEIDVLGRYGGDEFALILPETDAEGARVVALRLLERVRELVVHAQGVRESVTLSMGVATWPEHGEDGLSLLQSADEALYMVKGRGRNDVAIYQEGP